LTRLGAELDELAISRGDGALGALQGVARLALRRFVLLELLAELLDAPAQRLQLLVLGAGRRRRR
jgi:hypothetical protein